MAVNLRRGRPRDPQVDAAVTQAALDLLAEQGFAGMTIEGIAARAGVGKAAVYRRWSSKVDIVVDALNTKAPAKVTVHEHADIRETLRRLVADMIAALIGM